MATSELFMKNTCKRNTEKVCIGDITRLFGFIFNIYFLISETLIFVLTNVCLNKYVYKFFFIYNCVYCYSIIRFIII